MSVIDRLFHGRTIQKLDRQFPDWSMEFRDLAEQSTAKTPGYTDFMNVPLTGTEFSPDPKRGMKLLLLFKKKM
jgi:hypothetical protein